MTRKLIYTISIANIKLMRLAVILLTVFCLTDLNVYAKNKKKTKSSKTEKKSGKNKKTVQDHKKLKSDEAILEFVIKTQKTAVSLQKKSEKSGKKLTAEERDTYKASYNLIRLKMRGLIQKWCKQWYDHYKSKYDPELMCYAHFEAMFQNEWIWYQPHCKGGSWDKFKGDILFCPLPRNFTEYEIDKIVSIDLKYHDWALEWAGKAKELNVNLPKYNFASAILTYFRAKQGWKIEGAPTNLTATQVKDIVNEIKENGRLKVKLKAVKNTAKQTLAGIQIGPLGITVIMADDETGQFRALDIVKVESSGPAANKLVSGDKIILADKRRLLVYEDTKKLDDKYFGKKKFDRGPTGDLGKIINEVEGRKNPLLELGVLRDGRKMTVRIPLRRIGTYGSYYPFNCRKTDLIYRESCDYLLERLKESCDDKKVIFGAVGTPPSEIGNALGGLALLSHPNRKKYLPAVKRMIDIYLKNKETVINHSECISRANMITFFCEYYLATKDKRMPAFLKKMYEKTLEGQMAYGGWGHQLTAGTYGGGGFAIATSHMQIAIGMLSKCIKLDKHRTRHTLDHFNVITGSGGSVPYCGSFRGPTAEERAAGLDLKNKYQSSKSERFEFLKPGGEGTARTAGTALGIAMLNYDPNRNLPLYTAYLAEPKTYMGFEYPHSTHVMGLLWGVIALGNLDAVGTRAYFDYARQYLTLGRRYDKRLTLCSTRGKGRVGITTDPDGKYCEGIYAHSCMTLIHGLGKGKLAMFKGIEPLKSKSKYKDQLSKHYKWHNYYFMPADKRPEAPSLIASGKNRPLKPHRVKWHFSYHFDYNKTTMREVDSYWAVDNYPKSAVGKIVQIWPQILDIVTEKGERFHFLYTRGAEPEVTGNFETSDENVSDKKGKKKKKSKGGLTIDLRENLKYLKVGQMVKVHYKANTRRTYKSATIGIWGAARKIEIISQAKSN